MWKSCKPPTPLFIVFYNVYLATSLTEIVCLILMAIMLSGVFLRGSSPLQSSYFRLVLVGCLVNIVIAVVYKTSATILMTITEEKDDYSLSLMVVGICAWMTTFALSTSNFLFVLNRTTSLLCPTKHSSIWSPVTTFFLVLVSVTVPFLADWNSIFHPCRLRIFSANCSQFLLADTLYAAVIAFTLSIISLALAVLTLILTQKRASTVILRAEKHFILQTIVASASLTGFSVTLWLSSYFMTVGQASWSCALSFVYEGCYIIYIFSNYISYFFTSPIKETGYLELKFTDSLISIHIQNANLVKEYYYFCIREDPNPPKKDDDDDDSVEYDDIQSLDDVSNVTEVSPSSSLSPVLPACPDEFVPVELNTEDELVDMYTYYLQADGIMYLHYEPVRYLAKPLLDNNGTFEMYFPTVPKDIEIFFLNVKQADKPPEKLTFEGVMVIIGMAVICAILAFIVLALFAWYWCRRPRKKRLSDEEINESILQQMAKANIAYVDDDQIQQPVIGEPVEQSQQPTEQGQQPTEQGQQPTEQTQQPTDQILSTVTCIESSTETPPDTSARGSRELGHRLTPPLVTSQTSIPAITSPDTPCTPNVSPVRSPLPIIPIIIPPIPTEPSETERYLGFAQRHGIITMNEYTTIASKVDITMKHAIASMEAAVLDCPEADVGVRRANTLVAEADGRLLAKGVKFRKGWNQVQAVWNHINDPRTPATDGYRFLLRALPGLFPLKKQSLKDPTVEAMPLCGVYILLLDLTLDINFREKLFKNIRKRAAILFKESKTSPDLHNSPFPLPYLVELHTKSPELFKIPKKKTQQKEGFLSSAELFIRPITGRSLH